jgi:hypothetical protein
MIFDWREAFAALGFIAYAVVAAIIIAAAFVASKGWPF